MNKFPLLIVALVTVFFCSCNDDDVIEQLDFRSEFVGVYDCTKSTRSFGDTNFVTEIEVVVTLDSLNANNVIVNDISFPINEEGRYNANLDGNYYDLSLADDRIRWEINTFIPEGIALPCFIQGEKR